MKRKITVLALTLCLLVGGSLTAVEGESTDENEINTEEEKEEELLIAQRHEPSDFHPIRYTDVFTEHLFIQMYDTLISTYPEAEPNADADGTIAESFEVSDDGLEMTFDIEEGLEFHNGDEVTAHDAEFTINTLRMDEDEDEYFDLYDVEENPASPRSGALANIDYVEAVDDYTLEIHMEERDMEMLQSGAFESMYIMPRDYIEDNGWEDYEDNLFGSGPYELEDRTAGVEVILEEYEDYRHDVNIEQVRFDFIDEETGAITSLRNGEIHYMSRIYPSNFHDLVDEEDVVTRSFQDLGHNRIAFNQHADEAEHFDDARVRKALAYAIDADEVIEMEMTEELADNTRSPVPEGHAAHNPDLNSYEQDIEEAQDLLEEAGYEQDEDGFYFSTSLYVPDDERANEMLVVQEHAEEAGIEVEFHPLEWAEYIEAVESGEAPLGYSGWTGTPSAQFMMDYLMEGSPWAYYSGWYEGEEFTGKVEQAVREPDADTRWDLYHEAQEILVEEDMGCYILYTERTPRAYHESLEIPEESWNPYMGAGPLVNLPEWELEDEPKDEVIEIEDWYDLDDIREDRSGDYVLMNDLDENTDGYDELVDTEKGWEPIGDQNNRFTGTFDAQGHTIEDLYINRPDTDAIGLFGVVEEEGSVTDVNLADVEVTGRADVGALVGINNNQGTVRNTYAEGDVSGNNNVGGLIGTNWHSTVENSYGMGEVNGDLRIGGLVGQNVGTVETSYASGDVSGDDSIGGLVGWTDHGGNVSNSYATGDVSGDSYVGGLVGYNYPGSTLSNSYATGQVTGDEDIGGFVGRNDGTVENSYWDTDTSGQDESDGGTGKTTAEMKDVATFTDTDTEGLEEPWDFVDDPNDDDGDDEIWTIDENEEINYGYPYLTEFYEEDDVEDDEPEKRDLTITIDGEGITDPEEGTHTYDEGEEVTIEATPDEDWEFEEWTGDEESEDEEITVTMDEDKGITARFTEEDDEETDTYELTIIIDGEGTTEPEEGNHTYEEGEEVTIEATPDEHWEFEEWTGEVPEYEDGTEINITMDEDKEITAVFEEEDDDTPGFTIAVLVIASIVAVAVYQKKQ